MSPTNFVNQYFIEPIVFNEGYNLVNTTVYTLLAIVIVYLTFRFLKKLKISIDKRFALAIAPYVIFGALIRVLADSGILTSYLLFSPMIWIEMFFFVILFFLVSLSVQKRFEIPYEKTLFLIGIILIPIPLTFLKFVNFLSLGLIFAFFLPLTLIFCLVKWNEENKIVSLIHGFDAITTTVAIQFFGYSELHVIPSILITSFTPLSFIFVKVAVIVVVLLLIDRFSKDKQFNNFLKLTIGIFGAGPAVRDSIRLLALI